MQNDLLARTKQFALRVIRLYQALPKNSPAYVIGNQLLRSGTSVGANYRAAYRARSRADFVAKMAVTLEEAHESAYWLELLIESGTVKPQRLQGLLDEANQLVAIFAASRLTAMAAKPRARSSF